ncbi:helix-turn-helix domain-containing protein [Kinneretia aquatilis]|uniref:helix-turn-helix domain-containing protein n=1 Tax=Kinneretia aquatilis TaxID=2070761 RepID=UPI0014953D5E|nr:helix-turn-helix domain-containing protein [Paucibacter aquatile]WIV98448.1 helix-turn-helix domain-containing protein [Paucibacter aquatile]
MNTPILLAKKPKKLSSELASELREQYDEREVVRIEVQTPIIDIAALRKRLGMSQQLFAEKFGLSAQNIRNWEQGTRKPDRAALLYLAMIEIHPNEVMQVVRDRKSISDLG